MSVIDDIKARLDIVDVVSPYVTLQQSGRTFKANCPFHNERTPSFIVNAERQSWRCFGACATGGDAFSFVMKAENMDFGQALVLLAQRTGVQLERRGDPEKSDILHSINRAAANFYQETLKNEEGRQARNYITGRQLSDSSISKFMLGYSPTSGDGLKSYLQLHDFKIEDAIEAGLVRSDEESGRTYDFFRGRLMFPIFDRRGNIAGFGARALDDSNPKYINTAATSIFDKRATLYALNFAIDTIRNQRTAVVVEGYMDAIAAHEHGYTNVVASMGTALTEQQVAQLRTLADKFILALDPDTAGQEATLRSLESSWRVIQSGAAQQRQRSQSALTQWKTTDLRVAALPDGLDPDALIRKDASRWEEIIEGATPLLEFLIPNIAARFDLTVPHGKSQVVDVIWPLIVSLDRLDREQYAQKLADAIGVSLEALRASIGNLQASRRQSRRSAQYEPPPEVTESALTESSADPVEEYTLALLLSKPDLKEFAKNLDAQCFHNIENREVFTNWLACTRIEELWDSIDESLHPHLTHLTDINVLSVDLNEHERALAEMLDRLQNRFHKADQQNMLTSSPTGEPPPREWGERISEINANIRQSEPTGMRRE
ncbi:MAG: DNA primase [Chloroflexi bacterium]|nr:DNA primase [Chloroflexota bacterium]